VYGFPTTSTDALLTQSNGTDADSLRHPLSLPLYTNNKPQHDYYIVSPKNPTLRFSDIFPKQLGIFSPNFTCLLHVPI